MRRLIAKKPTKKELREQESQKKKEMGDFLMSIVPEEFDVMADYEPIAAKMLKGYLDDYDYEIEDLKTEKCDFMYQNLLYKSQSVFDRIADNFFSGPDYMDSDGVDDPYSDIHLAIESLIEDYTRYTDKRLYQLVPDKLIEKVKELYK